MALVSAGLALAVLLMPFGAESPGRALGQAVHYEGGDASRLAATLHAVAKCSIVVYSPLESLPSLDLDGAKSRDSMLAETAKALGLVVRIAGRSFALAPADLYLSYPDWGRAWERSRLPSATVRAGFASNDGLLTLITKPEECVAVQDLPGMARWTKPVRVHWFLKRFTVACFLEGVSEKEALRGFALACAGDLKETETAYEIDLDPSAFRSVMVRGYERGVALEPSSRYDRDRQLGDALGVAAFKAATDDQLNRLMSKSPNELVIDIEPASGLSRAASMYFNEKFYPQWNSGQTPVEMASLLGGIDQSKPMQVVIENRRGQVWLRARAKGKRVNYIVL